MTIFTPPRGIKTLWCSHPLPTDIFRHDLIRSCLHSERIAVLTTSKELLARPPRQIIGSVEITAGPRLHPTRSGTTPRLLVRILPARKASVHDRVVTSARLTFFDTERPTLPRRGKARASGCTTPHPHHRIIFHQLVSPRSPQLNSLGTLTGHHPTEAVPLEMRRGADGRYVVTSSPHRGESIPSPEHGGNVARSELGHLFARPSSR